MGDAEAADTGRIPLLHGHGVEGFRAVRGLIHVKGNYELLSDNLLDLSHTQFLHSVLTITQDEHATHSFELKRDGDTLTTREDWKNTSKHGFVQFVWPDGPERVDSYGGVRWQAPANMLLKVVFTKVGEPESSGLHAWGAELVTPETETTSHYFWSFARDYRLDDDAFDAALKEVVNGVFSGEDSWIIGLVQQKMGTRTDLLAMRPVLLPTDRAALTARRIMLRLKQQEADPAGPAAEAADPASPSE
jgi:vanillate O-demethylase monooxygenase subunit